MEYVIGLLVINCVLLNWALFGLAGKVQDLLERRNELDDHCADYFEDGEPFK
jgi:hypothetical protein